MYQGLRPLAPGTAPDDFGYATEEYFVWGTAEGQPYRTRILVRRPRPAQRFSGIVILEAMHSNGYAVTFEAARKSILMRGHVQVEVAAQKTNVDVTLKAFNPVRYASLSIASSAQTSEILAQVAYLLKSDLSGGPLASLSVRHLVLVGASQSSVVLRAFEAQKHFQERMPDASPLVDGYLAASTLGPTPMMKVDVPTIHMPTMTEATAWAAGGERYRRADSDEPGSQYRLYEVAGMAHADSRDVVAYSPNPCTLPVSHFPWGAMVAMGLDALVEWVDHGVTPPHAPPLEVDNDAANDGSVLALDENGNAKGGVRTPYVDVPVAAYGVPNAGATPAADFACSIAGWRIGYDAQTLYDLYRNHGAYVSRFDRRLLQVMRDGWILPEYAEDVRGDARAIFIPELSR